MVVGEGRLVLMRHAPTAWNRDGRVMGRTDMPIDDSGWGEAEAAAGKKEMRNLGINALFCSPLKRCVQTAQVFERALGINLRMVPGLEERGWGPFEGQPKEKSNRQSEAPGVEALAEFRARVFHALDWIVQQAGSPLVITHSGVIRAALHECGRDPVERLPHLMPIAIAWPLDGNAKTSRGDLPK